MISSYIKKGMFFLGFLMILTSCDGARQPIRTPDQDQGMQGEGDAGQSRMSLYVLIGKDIEEKVVEVLDLATKEEMTLNYNTATRVRTRNDSETSVPMLPYGEIVEMARSLDTGVVTEIKVSERAWEYPGVQRLKTNRLERMITLGDRNYKYNDKLVIVSNGQAIDFMDVNEVDELTVRGVEETIHSIEVTRGHGHIRPANYESFIGGMVSVGYGIYRSITENMVIVAREGTYSVTMKNGQLIGTQMVVVTRNEETPLDMIRFKPEAKPAGQVEFEITPLDADLFINGILTDYSEAVSLNYGEHEIRVTMLGYEDYTGTLDVRSPNPIVYIDLADDVAEVSGEGEGLSNINDSDGRLDNVVLDRDRTITVSEPVGANVYLNGALKGVAPCSFTKQIGTITISLSRSGYLTKSYTLEIINDEENVEWKFPPMTPSS